MSPGTKAGVAVTVAVITGAVWWCQTDADEQRIEAGERVTFVEGPEEAPTEVARVELPPVASPEDSIEPESDGARVPSGFAEVGPESVITLQGRVVDDVTGLPIAGARIQIGWNPSDPTTESDADGRFALEGVTAYFANTVISVSAPGYVTREEVATNLSPGLLDAVANLVQDNLGTIELSRGARLAGRVETAEGRPVAGAAVLLLAERSSSTFLPDQARRIATTASDGSFLVEHLAPDRHETQAILAVSDQGLGSAELSVPRGREMLPDLCVVVRPPGWLAVTVTDAEGHPIEGALVTAEPQFPPFVIHRRFIGSGEPAKSFLQVEQPDLARVLTAETDASGRAELRELPVPGAAYHPFQIAASAPGYVPGWKQGVGLDSELTLVLQADVPCSVSGLVRTADGVPIANASIGVLEGLPSGATPLPYAVRSSSAADGGYALELPPEQTITLAVRADGFALGLHEVHTRSGESIEGEDVVLEPARPIAGMVVDQLGEPVPFAWVWVSCETIPRLHGETMATDRSGRFTIPDTTEGEWTLTVQLPPPHGQWERGRLDQTVQAGEEDLVLTAARRLARGARVVAEVVEVGSGRLLDPVEAWIHSVDRPASIDRIARGHGQITVEHLPPGRWDLSLQVAEGTRLIHRFEVLEGASEVRLRIEVEPPGVVHGRVILDGLAPHERVLVQMARGGGVWADPPGNRIARRYQGIHPDGTFRFEGVTPGRAKLELSGPYPGSALVDVAPGAEVFVELRPVRGAWLHVSGGTLPAGEAQLWIQAGASPWYLADALDRAQFHLSAAVPAGPVRWRVDLRPWNDLKQDFEESHELGQGTADVVAGQKDVRISLD